MCVNKIVMDRFYVDIEGTRAIIRVLAHTDQRRREWLKILTLDLGRHAMMMMRVYAPSGQSNYLHSHINMSGIVYRPGGAGGGGSYEVIAGVRRGTSEHPIYVHQGTKNPEGQTIHGALVGGTGDLQGRIYAKGAGAFGRATSFTHAQRKPVLTFQKRGEPRRFRAWVSGQRPQPFAYFAFGHTAVYAKGRIRAGAEAALISPL